MDLASSGPGVVVDQGGNYGLIRASLQRIVDDSAANEAKGEDYGEQPIVCALGVMASPAAPDAATGRGAEFVVKEDVAGFPCVGVAGWDARCTDVAGQLSPGDTCLHGTHTDKTKRAKVFCKEDLLALLVGNDVAFTIDRGAKAITISAFGALFQITDEQTLVTDPQGKSYIRMANGTIELVGNLIMGNPVAGPMTPTYPIALGPTPGVVSTSVKATL